MTPITYPMRPLNGGSLDKVTAIIPPWPRAYEPKVNGWRVLVHVPTGTCWNRHLEPLTIADEFKPALAKLKDQPSFEWLDCEGLSRRHGYGKGSLVVLDIISLLDDTDNVWRDMDYTLRREAIEFNFENELGLFISDVQENEVYRLPSLTTWQGRWPEATWKIMQAQNMAHNLTGENVFFEGFVCKRLDSTYTVQLQDPRRETSNWIKHRKL